MTPEKGEKMTKTEKILMKELLHLASSSEAYIRGNQWAVNAVDSARMLVDANYCPTRQDTGDGGKDEKKATTME